jgi:hypothetical protein
MCENGKHDYIVAGSDSNYVYLVCRHCGEKIKHPVGSDFKLNDMKLTIEEKQ